MDWANDKARWDAEAKLGMFLDHPYIIKIFSAGKLGDGMGVMAMEAAQCDLVKRFGGYEYADVNRAEVAEYTLQILWGLKYMHANGYVHADLKPDQVMLQGCECESESPCEVRIADLGLAVEATKDNPHKGFQGSLMYLAPEIAGNEPGEIYPAADMWALGASLYEILNEGAILYSASSTSELVRQLAASYKNAKEKKVRTSWFSEKYEKEKTAVNALLYGLLTYLPEKRISAETAIKRAEKWAKFEGVSEDKIKTIRDKGTEAEQGKAHGATPPTCWQV